MDRPWDVMGAFGIGVAGGFGGGVLVGLRMGHRELRA